TCSSSCASALSSSISGPLGCCSLYVVASMQMLMSLNSGGGPPGSGAMTPSSPVSPLTDAYVSACGVGTAAPFCPATTTFPAPMYLGLRLDALAYAGAKRSTTVASAVAAALVADLASLAYVDTAAIAVNNVQPVPAGGVA